MRLEHAQNEIQNHIEIKDPGPIFMTSFVRHHALVFAIALPAWRLTEASVHFSTS